MERQHKLDSQDRPTDLLNDLESTLHFLLAEDAADLFHAAIVNRVQALVVWHREKQPGDSIYVVCCKSDSVSEVCLARIIFGNLDCRFLYRRAPGLATCRRPRALCQRTTGLSRPGSPCRAADS